MQYKILQTAYQYLKVFDLLQPLVKNTQRRLMLLATMFKCNELHQKEHKSMYIWPSTIVVVLASSGSLKPYHHKTLPL